MWSHIWAFTPLSSMRCLFFFYHVLSSMEMCILAAMAFCCLCSFCCTSSREFHSVSLSGKRCTFAMLFYLMWRRFQPRCPPCLLPVCGFPLLALDSLPDSCCGFLPTYPTSLQTPCMRLYHCESFIFVSSEIILLYVRDVFVVVLNYMRINLTKYFPCQTNWKHIYFCTLLDFTKFFLIHFFAGAF